MMAQFVAIYCLRYCHMFSNSHKLKLARLVSMLSWDIYIYIYIYIFFTFYLLPYLCVYFIVCYLFNLLLFAYILFTVLIMSGMCVFGFCCMFGWLKPWAVLLILTCTSSFQRFDSVEIFSKRCERF
jgi:hypothetical protein